MRVKIKTPSRIHVTLLDLNASIGRMDGGIGLALEEPFVEIEAEESDEISVEGQLKERALDAAKKMAHAIGIDGGVRVRVKSAYPQHVGMGSGTQVALAVGNALCELYDVEMSTVEIAKIVGRGGTSGIGVAAFENGGFILDGGHSTKVKKDFLPSSASRAPPPPVLARYDFPDWKVVLVTPKRGSEVHGGREVSIFQKHCPIPLGEVRELIHTVLMKVLPAVVENDIKSFGEGIALIQKTGFKKIEVGLQSAEVKRLMAKCRRYAPAVGLSSFGPTIYCITEDENALSKALRNENADIITTKANNRGATVRAVRR